MSNKGLNEKIKKLLALADSSNPNEAALALQRAKKLMEMHKLEMSDFDDNLISELSLNSLRGLKQNELTIKLCDIIAHAYSLDFYLSMSGSRISSVKFIGPKSSLEIAEYSFVYLSRAIIAAKKHYQDNLVYEILYEFAFGTFKNTNLREYFLRPTILLIDLIKSNGASSFNANFYNTKQLVMTNNSNRRADRNYDRNYKKIYNQKSKAFVMGYLNSLVVKVREFAQDKQQLERINLYLENNHPELTSYNCNRKRMNKLQYEAYQRGLKEGEELALNDALNQGQTSKRLEYK